MSKILNIILGLIIYFIGGWIIESIVFSIIELPIETTFQDMFFYECLIHSILSGLYLFVLSVINKEETTGIPIAIISIMCVLVYYLPLSYGIIVLYNVVNIVAIVWGCLIYTQS